MTTTIHTQRLQSACRIIFGDTTRITPEFIDYLQPSGLRDAYKKAAMKSHPDRAQRYNIPSAVLTNRFRRVRESYDLLYMHLEERSQLGSSKMQSATSKRGGLWQHTFFKWFKN